MVTEYLEKIRDQFLEQKIETSNRMSELSNQYKENIEFIKLLEESNDPNFESFTPRKVNGFNKSKIAELEETQKIIVEELSQVRKELEQLDTDIYELNSVIKVSKENRNIVSNDTMDDNENNIKITLLETLENERQRIARELHDSTVQNLTSMVHKTELCSKLIDSDPIRCKLELMSMGKNLRDIIEDTRNMIYDLRPMSFDDIGFEVTVERFLDKVKISSGKNISFKIEGDIYPIQSVIGITLLRVIQEACYNSIKHSYATSINVRLLYNEDSFIVEIKDDGKGFVQETMDVSREDNSGFGLSIMKERIYLLSGKLEIETSPGKGCCIRTYIPMKKEDNEDGR